MDRITWVSLGQLGRVIDFFHAEGVSQAVMAGQVKHTQLFRGILPDARALKLLLRVKDKRADALLSAVSSELASEGIELLPSTTYLDHLLPTPGCLTRRSPSAQERADLDFGFPVAKAIAELDIGQTVAVKSQAVVAVEAMEGTNACIQRAGQLTGGGFVVVKVARPRQDFRFDLPVIGPLTIRTLAEQGAHVLGIEAHKTLLLEKDDLLAAARAADITLIAFAPTY
ncbi:MAG: LpxI family protein [Elusimicrobia bacterium]|nr:LpxI family protein [Elusimicrobiota bacterium]